MGQYYLIVNPAKREYLNPHKFGCGLKLMEFSCSSYGPQTGLMILLAHANGRGGGDLRCKDKGIRQRLQDMVGSWAGDPIVVAGDYDDPWLWVPDDIREREFRESYYEKVPDPHHPGKYVEKTRYRKIRFNQTVSLAAPYKTIDCDRNLYAAAEEFFTDISDDVIKLVALSESPYHPWGAIDAADKGWRRVPGWGVLPESEPVKPLAGKKAWEAYKAQAKPWLDDMVDDLADRIRRASYNDLPAGIVMATRIRTAINAMLASLGLGAAKADPAVKRRLTRKAK